MIQIPCFNEAETLPLTLAALPREVPGIDIVEWLVIDDGSSDKTSEIALANGVDHVVRLPRNQGLARAFMAGLDACVQKGADIIVNTDADNQYHAGDIPSLVEPILNGRAEIVIGVRPIAEIEHFSLAKKMLQRLGSWVVQIVSKTAIPDAPSGFRAISREAARRLNVFNTYTYTLETIIQAGQSDMAITSVPVRTNPDLRPSRLLKSIPSYIKKSMVIIIRVFMTYQPFKFFFAPGFLCFGLGFALGLRFLIYYLAGHGGGKIQSLILASLLLGMGAILIVVGLLADLISVNRRIVEENRWRLRRMEEKINQMVEKQDSGQEVK